MPDFLFFFFILKSYYFKKHIIISNCFNYICAIKFHSCVHVLIHQNIFNSMFPYEISMFHLLQFDYEIIILLLLQMLKEIESLL